MHRSLIAALGCILILGFFSKHALAQNYACTELDKQKKCPVFNNVGIGGSNYPSTTMIKMAPIINALGETSVAFETPFCRNCGFVFSYYPISYDEGMNNLVKDGEFTSLNENIMSAGTWGDWWKTGESNCDATASGKLMNSASNMMDVSVVDACTQSRTMKFSTFNQKKDMLLPNGKNAYVLTTSPIYATLSTQIYAQAMYPYSLSTSAEKYATRRSIYTFSTKYMLQAEVFADAKVISQREIVVKTTASSPRVLQVDLQLKTQTGNYWIENSCKALDSEWGMQVIIMQINDNTATLKMLGSVEKERYTGEIRLQCSTERCTDAGTCETHKVNDIVVRVDQDTPDEIVTTSKFTPTVQQFVGPAEKPFEKENFQGSSGNYWVSLGIGQEEYLAGFSSQITHLRMCSGPCASNPEYNLLLLKNGQPNDQLFINRLGLRLYSNSEMRAHRPDISGVAPLGLSFLYESIKTLKHTSWYFELGLTFLPDSAKRGEIEETRTLVVRGVAADKETEESFMVKSIDLLPSSATTPSLPDSSSSSDKLVAILVPTIAGGTCLLCMFSIVALVGLCLLVGIVRKATKTGGVSVHHNRMEDDASVPSDSDTSLRNHAV